MLIAKKHKQIHSRKVHFWIKIWLDRGDGLRAGSEVSDDGNTSSDDGNKGRCQDRLLAYNTEII